MTETDGLRVKEKAEMRGGGCETTETGGSGEQEGKGVEMNKGEDFDDRDCTDGSADREGRGDWSHLYGPQYCSGCHLTPFACGCLDVSFEIRGEKLRRERRERERQAWCPDQWWGYSGIWRMRPEESADENRRKKRERRNGSSTTQQKRGEKAPLPKRGEERQHQAKEKKSATPPEWTKQHHPTEDRGKEVPPSSGNNFPNFEILDEKIASAL